MGSESDLEVMKNAALIMKEFSIPFEIKVVSAHRTPERMYKYANSAKSRGIEVIIAGAGGAAHLLGMVASMTYEKLEKCLESDEGINNISCHQNQHL